MLRRVEYRDACRVTFARPVVVLGGFFVGQNVGECCHGLLSRGTAYRWRARVKVGGADWVEFTTTTTHRKEVKRTLAFGEEDLAQSSRFDSGARQDQLSRF